jgi:hypothetical protein
MKKVEVIHHIIGENNFGGCAIMATHQDGDSFLRIATEPCSIHDQYSKKIANHALRKNYEEGKFIRIPITARRNVSHRQVRGLVIDMFGNNYIS